MEGSTKREANQDLGLGRSSQPSKLDSGDKFANGIGLKDGLSNCTGNKKKIFPTKLDFGGGLANRTWLKDGSSNRTGL